MRRHSWNDFDEKMLEIMEKYNFDYKIIVAGILKGKIDFNWCDINRNNYNYKYNFYEEVIDRFNLIDKESIPIIETSSLGSSSAFGSSENVNLKNISIKYSNKILQIGNECIKDPEEILKFIDIFIECLEEHGEYIKEQLEQRKDIEEKLSLFDDEDIKFFDVSVDENKTDDLF